MRPTLRRRLGCLAGAPLLCGGCALAEPFARVDASAESAAQDSASQDSVLARLDARPPPRLDAASETRVDAGTADNALEAAADAQPASADAVEEPPTPGTSCTGTLCGSECVDRRTSLEHCGACGHVCVSGLCTEGRCIPRGTTDNPGTNCLDILSRGGSRGDGAYWVLRGEVVTYVDCDMSTDGGGWTLLTSAVVDALPAGEYRYLYVHGASWYESPPTTLLWSWGRGQQLTGTYHFFDGSVRGTLLCGGSSELPPFGIGCSDGPGSSLGLLPGGVPDPLTGSCAVCQDFPDAFGVGGCTENLAVSVYVR